MSANRETNHDMATDTDIAFLLAEAADEVEIGTAPYQAVLRGGRRRKARRWAMAAAAALVIAGSTGTLALAGGTESDGRKAVPAVTAPSTPEKRHVYEPQATTVARGTEHGKEWSVEVIVWGAPKNEMEAQYQRSQMSEYALTPTGTEVASDLVGRGWVFVRLHAGDAGGMTLLDGAVEKGDSFSGTDLESASTPLRFDAASSDTSQRLVIGKVAPTAREVTCSWDDGTTMKAGKAAPEADQASHAVIRPVDGSQPTWFLCLAPEGKHYTSGTAKVTR
jgi:hypothetical protein